MTRESCIAQCVSVIKDLHSDGFCTEDDAQQAITDLYDMDWPTLRETTIQSIVCPVDIIGP